MKRGWIWCKKKAGAAYGAVKKAKAEHDGSDAWAAALVASAREDACGVNYM